MTPRRRRHFTRSWERPAQWSFTPADQVPADAPCVVIAEDQFGTYALPFRCRFRDGFWVHEETGDPIIQKVVAWREGSLTPGGTRAPPAGPLSFDDVRFAGFHRVPPGAGRA